MKVFLKPIAALVLSLAACTAVPVRAAGSIVLVPVFDPLPGQIGPEWDLPPAAQ